MCKQARRTTCRRNLRDGGGGIVMPTAIVHSHSKTVCGKTQGNRPPDTATRPGDQYRFSHAFPPWENKDAGIVTVPSGGQGTRPWRHDARGRC